MKNGLSLRCKGLEQLHLEGKAVLVALSGGADSVALLRLLHERGMATAALHCNFHLRGEESNRDERFVTQLCHSLGIALHIRHFDTLAYAQTHTISTEMAARDLRYTWFREMLAHLHADFIAVAHHREDQAETVLLHLVRGTGLRGLAGMRLQNGPIIRPLLYTAKADILQYLHDIGQTYVTDSTNLERDALRNRIRLDVMPLLLAINPKATEHIAEAARRVEEAIPYYIKGVDAAESLTATTLHERLRGCGFNAAQEADILRSVQHRSNGIFSSPTHLLQLKQGELLLTEREEPDTPPTLRTEIVEPGDALAYLRAQPLDTSTTAYFDADLTPLPLTLRHPRTGDRFQPFGMGGRSRLVSDYLTDQKLSQLERRRQWLACAGEDIIWVVGRRSDHPHRVTTRTRRILIVHIL